ncbi:hypothetical protein ACFC18_43895 [Streptomyces sp. NPDC056121]|uniref:hypothetical protein n=1 Tax=unclassified Streptomyces TaxID=2593676 RepID=UPI0035D74DE1
MSRGALLPGGAFALPAPEVLLGHLAALTPRVRGEAPAFRCHAAFLRPDVEATLNALGVTLAQLRDAVERATRDTLRDGDDRFALLPGAGLLTAAHLVNGVHPGDEGHALLARAVAENLTGNKFLGAIFGKALD